MTEEINVDNMTPSRTPEEEDGVNLKKKKRRLGRFPCPSCSKVFSRSDHLARHHLNHRPKEVYTCNFLIKEIGNTRKCGKTFVRRDLKERHVKRHYESESITSQTSPKFITGSKYIRSHSKGYPVDPPSGLDSGAKNMEKGLFQSSVKIDAEKVTEEPMPHTSSSNLEANLETPFKASIQKSGVSESLGVPFIKSPKSPVSQSQGDLLSWFFLDNATSPLNPLSLSGPFPLNDKQAPLSVNTAQTNIFPSTSDLITDNNDSNFSNNSRSSLSVNVQHERPVSQNNLPETGYVDKYFRAQDNFVDESSLRMMNEMHESRIFSNNDNLLDEIILKEYGDQIPENHATSEVERNNDSIRSSSQGLMTPSKGTSNTSSLPSDSFDSPELEVEVSDLRNFKFGYKAVKACIESIIPSSMDGTLVDETTSNKIFEALNLHPSKAQDTFECHQPSVAIEDRLSFYINLYWSMFHPQYPILHKPSFNTRETEPLLLASMILMGCCFTASSYRCDTAEGTKLPAYDFCMMIASPLRFKVFEHEDFKSPVKLWILQCLNILEWCEKNFLSRRMHERAHVHHATTVQLLIRSPLLGGNPSMMGRSKSDSTSGGEDESDQDTNLGPNPTNEDLELFRSWVESESFKRVTFMTFHSDIIDYIKFRHSPVISLHQLQLLSLPCNDDSIWNSYELNGSFKKVVRVQRKLKNQISNSMRKLGGSKNFLSVLKQLINCNSSEAIFSKSSLFTKRILYSGLVSVMYQIQQMSLMNSNNFLNFGNSQNMRNHLDSCTSLLSKVLDNWCVNVDGTCTHLFTIKSPKFLAENEGTYCKFAMYHLTQIIGMSDLNHYDIAIYGGSPGNMSVSASQKDRIVIQRKLESLFSKNPSSGSIGDLVNFKAVVHGYLLLWELMLKPVDDPNEVSNTFIGWNFELDVYDSAYAITIATLVLWCYTHSVCGVESTTFLKNEIKENDYNYTELVKLSAEGGYQYLSRIRREFTSLLDEDSKDLRLHAFKSERFKPHEAIERYCSLLPNITNKQNISGLCFLVGTKFLNSSWELLRENAKLILNCGFRSIGKNEVNCEVFENNYIQ